MIHWRNVRYFEPTEFDDPEHPGSGELIDGVLLLSLDKLRHFTGWPIVIHRGGGVDVHGTHGHAEKSFHRLDQGAKAADWHFTTSASIESQVREVLQFGFGGTGLYFCWGIPVGFHTDMRPVEKYCVWKCSEKGLYIYLC